MITSLAAKKIFPLMSADIVIVLPATYKSLAILALLSITIWLPATNKSLVTIPLKLILLPANIPYSELPFMFRLLPAVKSIPLTILLVETSSPAVNILWFTVLTVLLLIFR